MATFFAELKRRNVLRAAALYAAAAWLLVQVATQVFPFFHIAEWVVRAVAGNSGDPSLYSCRTGGKIQRGNVFC